MWTCDQVWPIRAFCHQRCRDWFRNKHVTLSGRITVEVWGVLEVRIGAIFATIKRGRTESPKVIVVESTDTPSPVE